MLGEDEDPLLLRKMSRRAQYKAGLGKGGSRRTQSYDKRQAKRTIAVQSRRGRLIDARSLRSKDIGYVDYTIAGLSINTTGSLTLMATIPQNSSQSGRVGKRIIFKSIQMRGLALADTTATINDCSIILVYDRKPTNALPAVTDVLVTASPSAMNNDTNSGRFKILKRIDFVLTGNSTAPASGMEAYNTDCFYKFPGGKDSEGTFKAGADGVIGDIEKGALYLLLVGNVAAGTADVTLNGIIRTRYWDA